MVAHTDRRFLDLGDVVVLIWIIFVPFHVVAIDERFDSFLEIWRLHRKLELIVEFCDEQIVRQRFTHFHDSDDGRVNLVLPILEHPFLRRLLLLSRLL